MLSASVIINDCSALCNRTQPTYAVGAYGCARTSYFCNHFLKKNQRFSFEGDTVSFARHIAKTNPLFWLSVNWAHVHTYHHSQWIRCAQFRIIIWIFKVWRAEKQENQIENGNGQVSANGKTASSHHSHYGRFWAMTAPRWRNSQNKRATTQTQPNNNKPNRPSARIRRRRRNEIE